MMRVAGVDDAGRGPVIGPLVIAGVLFDEKGIERLEAMGIKESKALSPRGREVLCRLIKDAALSFAVVELSPAQIDEAVRSRRRLFKLNRLEARAMAEVIARLRPDVAYVDASDVNAKRFGGWVRERLPFETRIVSEQKADARYPVVGAASIIAKVRRDEVVASLRREYGDFGSGYASDARTRRFLVGWLRRHGSFPPIVRQSWKTLRRLRELAQDVRYRGVTIEAVKGDITDMGVDAIVNPANSLMIMGGGVALAIKRKGGGEIEREARRRAPVEVGQSVVTSAGRLRARFVIHSPTMERPSMRIGAENVRLATMAALRRAEEMGIESVAFPALGAGVGGLSKERATRTMVSAMKAHVAGGTRLKRIVLVAYDDEAFGIMRRIVESDQKSFKNRRLSSTERNQPLANR